MALSHRRDLAAAEPAHDLERIVEMVTMQRHRLFHRRDFALEHLAFRTGAGSHPVTRRTAVERIVDRRRNRRIADAHLADAEQVGAVSDRLHAECHGRGAIALGKCCLLGDITGRIIERQIEDFQSEIIGDTDLIDRSTTRCEVLDHLLRHRWWKGRDALLGDAVIA